MSTNKIPWPPVSFLQSSAFKDELADLQSAEGFHASDYYQAYRSKNAFVNWAGSQAIVWGEDRPTVALFVLSTSGANLPARIKAKAAKLGYATPQIYAAAPGQTLRIWL